VINASVMAIRFGSTFRFAVAFLALAVLWSLMAAPAAAHGGSHETVSYAVERNGDAPLFTTDHSCHASGFCLAQFMQERPSLIIAPIELPARKRGYESLSARSVLLSKDPPPPRR
jgi:hypothetical protein